MQLKDDMIRRQHLKGDLSTILGILDFANCEDAEDFIKWMSKKAQMYQTASSPESHLRLPSNLVRGDIVMCDFGINIRPEFSDKGGRKHFAMFWSQQGHNAIVIPITTKFPGDQNKHTVPIGSINGFSEKENYIKIDSIRSVSLYRLSRIAGHRNGKIAAQHIIPKVKKALTEFLIDD